MTWQHISLVSRPSGYRCEFWMDTPLDHLYSGEANPKQTFQLTPETWICYVNCYLIEIFRSISHLTKNLKIFSVGLLVDQMRQICSKSKFFQIGIKIFLAKNVTRSALHLLWICLARVKMVWCSIGYWICRWFSLSYCRPHTLVGMREIVQWV